MLEPAPNPATLPAPASYHWTPALQSEFLGHLAALGSVRGAALFVQMTTRAAYDLRDRRSGLAFKLGWAAAILVARDRLQDELLDRAFTGALDIYERIPMGEPGAWQIRRRRINAPASMAMLERLDRQVAERATSREAHLARIIAANFGDYLDLFTSPAFAADPDAALAAWFADQRARPDPLAALCAPPAHLCEVAQISADFADEETPEEAASDLSVWYDDEMEEWRTDFPPPSDDFDGHEDGEFGDDGYSRSLSDDEFATINARETAAKAAWFVPFHSAAEARRREVFGLDAAAETAEAA
jgi:hypothetical protein